MAANDSKVDKADYSETDIAVVGMALRLPGASSQDEFWTNLKEGRESIDDLSESDLLASGVAASDLADPNYVKRAPLLKRVEWFDAAFFGLNPNEASVMDPQHRLFLECGWHALEDAGHDPANFKGPIGVFGGSGYNAYMTYHLAQNRELLDSMGFFLLRHTGNDKDFLTTRLSYCLNLTGPSVNVQTACSTSLVAAHLAIQSLINFECDMALAGGVTIELPLNHGYRFIPGEIYSPDGHCRAFDADSQGTVFGSGGGIVVLRRLEDALNDGDNIRAVIRASAINNDGSGKAGYLAPSVEGQAKSIAEALEYSGVDPESVGYIETHGTGTAVGDPIEVSALTAAYGAKTNKKQYCAIGSVKTNIGHLDTAAGVASLIKVILAMENQSLPPSLHYNKPNPEIDFESTPFYVNAQLQDWQPEGNNPRRAGVSSLGVGGTNAHIVLEEAPTPVNSGESRPTQLFLLSAKNDVSLQTASDNLIEFVAAERHALADIAYTYQVGRRHFEKRRAIVCRSADELIARLDDDKHELYLSGEPGQTTPPVAFMFAGQGAQYVGMAKQLYETESVFREEFDRCADILVQLGAADIRALTFDSEPDNKTSIEAMNQTENTQPALFVIEYCLAKLWMHWGIVPNAMIGHSVGEYAAACLSGVFTLEDSLALVSLRGRLMQSASRGSMLAVSISSQEVQGYLSERIELAGINATSLCVLSGDTDDILNVQKQLDAQEITCTLLKTSHAFHSRTMEPILDEFEKAVVAANPQPPSRPFLSNLTGSWITDQEAVDPRYWSRHLRCPVLFAAGISKLLEDSERVFLEVGPGSTLKGLVKQHEKYLPTNTVVETLEGPKSALSDSESLLRAVGKLWTAGVNLDWEKFYEGEQRRKVSAPGYAFNRQRYWVDRVAVNEPTTEEASLIANDLQTSNVVWNSIEIEPIPALTSKVLVIGFDNAETDSLIQHLRGDGVEVITAKFSEKYQESAAANFLIRITSLEDYEKLFSHADHLGVGLVLHCANLGKQSSDEIEQSMKEAFISPLMLMQSMANQADTEIVFLSSEAYSVVGDESLVPVRSLLTGPALVGGIELPHLVTTVLDVAGQSSAEITAALLQVVAEHECQPSLFALRGGKLYCRSFETCQIESGPADSSYSDGCYLITGGASGLGLEVARYLAADGCKNIALLGKTSLPSAANWDSWLKTHGGNDPISARIRCIRELQESADHVNYFACDLEDGDSVGESIRQIKAEFGGIRGVIHCAGIVNDGPLLSKTVEDALAVLAPKVKGTLELARLLADQAIENFVLFSSVSSLVGAAGQVDYVSANAFLDAVASEIENHLPGRVLSLNWAAWRDTGMTERLANAAETDSAQTAHPLVDRCLASYAGTSIYATEMHADKHWIINEHRAANSNEPILPGTGFLGIVKAAYEPLVNENHVQFSDVMFLSPFVLTDEEPRELRVQFEPWSLGTTFSVISQADEEDTESWFVHMKGRIGHGPSETRKIDLAAISARCSAKQAHPNEQVKFLKFGPRWETIQSLQLGEDEALLALQLGEEYLNDVDSIWSHPGMLDVATAGVLELIEGFDSDKDFYVPIAYNKISFYRAMPAKWISHIVYRAADSQAGDVVVFDVTICDEEGEVLAIFEEFMLKCIDGPEFLVGKRPPLSARVNPLPTDLAPSPNTLLQARLQESGIDVEAGIAAFGSILTSDVRGQIAISRGDLSASLRTLVDPYDSALAEQKTGAIALDISVVEDLLDEHDAVIRSAVLVREDRFGDTNIAAFVQLDPMLTTTVSELRRFVRKNVDEQLVPSKFVEIEKLPTTAQGAIDKSKLPDPFSADDEFIAPSTETEKMLAEIWKNILGVDQISITDNFFDLGGHSLLGVRLLAAIRKATTIRLEDVVVVTYTLEQISAELDKRTEQGADA